MIIIIPCRKSSFDHRSTYPSLQFVGTTRDHLVSDFSRVGLFHGGKKDEDKLLGPIILCHLKINPGKQSHWAGTLRDLEDLQDVVETFKKNKGKKKGEGAEDEKVYREKLKCLINRLFCALFETVWEKVATYEDD